MEDDDTTRLNLAQPLFTPVTKNRYGVLPCSLAPRVQVVTREPIGLWINDFKGIKEEIEVWNKDRWSLPNKTSLAVLRPISD